MADKHLTPDPQPTQPQQPETAPNEDEAFPFAANIDLEGSTVILKKSRKNKPSQPSDDDEHSDIDGSTLIIRH